MNNAIVTRSKRMDAPVLRSHPIYKIEWKDSKGNKIINYAAIAGGWKAAMAFTSLMSRTNHLDLVSVDKIGDADIVDTEVLYDISEVHGGKLKVREVVIDNLLKSNVENARKNLSEFMGMGDLPSSDPDIYLWEEVLLAFHDTLQLLREREQADIDDTSDVSSMGLNFELPKVGDFKSLEIVCNKATSGHWKWRPTQNTVINRGALGNKYYSNLRLGNGQGHRVFAADKVEEMDAMFLVLSKALMPNLIAIAKKANEEMTEEFSDPRRLVDAFSDSDIEPSSDVKSLWNLFKSWDELL
jgi:hypothetical protein